jgi:hypothetical protein
MQQENAKRSTDGIATLGITFDAPRAKCLATKTHPATPSLQQDTTSATTTHRLRLVLLSSQATTPALQIQQAAADVARALRTTDRHRTTRIHKHLRQTLMSCANARIRIAMVAARAMAKVRRGIVQRHRYRRRSRSIWADRCSTRIWRLAWSCKVLTLDLEVVGGGRGRRQDGSTGSDLSPVRCFDHGFGRLIGIV